MFQSLLKFGVKFVFLLLFQFCITGVAQAQIYLNDFEGGGIAGTTSFTGGATGDPNLGIAASTWSTDGVFTTFVGTAPSAATSMALQPGTAATTTWTLNVPVNPTYSTNITALDLDYRSTSTSYDFLTIAINGTTVYSGAALTDATFHHISLTGLTLTGITGNISIVSVMSGGSHGSSSTFRYDNVAITGVVIPANHAPSFTGGAIQSLSVCENSTMSVNSLMTVSDIDAGQTETWTVSAAPLHGVLNGFSTSSTSTGSTVTPTGLTYTPVAGYSGSDVFTIQVSDGYTTATTTVNVIVDPAPAPITGVVSFCQGTTTYLSDVTPGGAWSSSDLSVATADPSTGLITGVSAGVADITYTAGGSGCSVSVPVTINPGPMPISGPTGVCAGATIQLSDAVAGGIWSTGNNAIATITGSGLVFGVSSGTAVISYTIGSCTVNYPVAVTTLAPITGNTNLCAGTTTVLSDATPGGVWSSANPAAATISSTGVVSGVNSGSAAIYYSVGACYVSAFVNVGFAITNTTGPDSVCSGLTIVLANATIGGIWSSANTTIATVAGGNVRGVSQGVVTISYTVGSCSETHDVVVKAGSAGTIVGKDSLCKGPAHIITLSDAVTGGVWSSSNTLRATVDPVTGVVMGVNPGVDTIRYTVTNSCGTFKTKKMIYIRTPAKCATGVDEATDELVSELKIFPNPNNGMFTINLVSAENEDAHVIVVNIMGQVIDERMITSNRPVEMKISPTPGIYLISASTSRDRYVSRVIVN